MENLNPEGNKSISLRKINGFLIVLMIVILLYHAVLSVLFLFGLIQFTPDIVTTGQILLFPLVGHIIVSCYMYYTKTKKSSRKHSKLASEKSMRMISGVAIIVFVILHGLSYMMLPPYIYSGFYFKLMHFLIDIFLFISIALHLRVTMPRFLVYLGLLKGKDSYNKFKFAFNIFNYVWLAIAISAEVVCYWVLL